MADNFNLRAFLTENKLTKNAKLLKEEVSLNGKPVDISSIEIDNIDMDDYPDFVDAYIVAADYEDGTPLTDEELEQFQEENYGLVGELIHDNQLYLEGKKETWEEGVINESLMGQVVDLLGVTNDQAQMILGVIGAMGLTGASAVMSKIHDMAMKGVFGPSIQAKAKKLGKLGSIAKDTTQQKEAVQETLTAKERRLVEMVEKALGEEHQNADPNVPNDSTDMAIDMMKNGLPEGDEISSEPLPTYENIEKLMQEIEHGTNKASHEYKMNRMKEVAEMLENKVTSLEEGEHAEHIDQKAVKQMRKDIATLRKAEEKLRKEFDKKFAEKKEKKETK